MVKLYKEEIVCVILAHRTCMFVLTIALTLTFGLAHKTCICLSCLLQTSESLLVNIPLFRLLSWRTRLGYVRLVSWLRLTELVRFSKSPWLASRWLLKASHWRISLDAAIFNKKAYPCSMLRDLSNDGPSISYLITLKPTISPTITLWTLKTQRDKLALPSCLIKWPYPNYVPPQLRCDVTDL